MLMNFIDIDKLDGRRGRFHFSDHYIVTRSIRDRDRGGFKDVTSHVFWVDSLDGNPAAQTFSVLSQKLWAQLEPFIEHKRFLEYEFLIACEGSGFSKEFRVQPLRLTV